MSKIKVYGPYGNARALAAGGDDTPHGLTPGQVEDMRDRFESFMPKLAASHGSVHDTLNDIMPDGASLSVNAGRGYRDAVARTRRTATSIAGMPGNGVSISPQQSYAPEFASPDRQCFVEGTPVVMADGTWKSIEEVKPGDIVLNRVGEPALVEDAWDEGVPDQLIELNVWGGRQFLCTPNHNWPVWTWIRQCLCGCGTPLKPGRCYVNHHHPKVGGPDLKIVSGTERNFARIPADFQAVKKITAAEIQAGDQLMMPRSSVTIAEETVSPAQARLLGYYVAEGCSTNHGSSTKFSLNITESTTLAADIAGICTALDVDTYAAPAKSTNGLDVYTKSDIRRGGAGKARDLQTWLQTHAGVGSPTKRLSEEVMHWPLQLKEEVIRGAFRGDGCQRWRSVRGGLGRSFGISYITTSPFLAAQFVTLLTQLGFPSRTYTRAAFIDNTGTQHRQAYTLEFNGAVARRLADRVWGDWSRTAHDDAIDSHAGPRVDDDFVYVKVKSVAAVPNSRQLRVFNLAVSGDHSYQVAGVATYNSYPVHRILANRYWRLFYKMDPVIGNGVDMLSELPWGNFELSGEGVDGEVKDTLELMCETTQLRAMLPYLIREYLIVGEACPHLFFDDDRGIWTYIAMHNPDQLEVIDAPFIKMDPVVEFVPDHRLQEVLTSDNVMLRRVRESMPHELVVRLMARENIPLSPINFTFIPRKMHPYDTRGTSIISRMWRILMYEDAIMAASLATARRHAGPLKVAKLGNPANGWIPGPEHEQKLLQLLAQAEVDVNSWLVYNYAISFELVGSNDRVMTIDKHYELIERIKLVSLGISKAFVHGEVSYASAASGLTVFMARLKAMRQMFESKWLYPKFFKTVAKINKWVKPTEAELSHRVRVKRSARELEDDNRYIIPTIEWDRTLDPSVDGDMIAAMQALQGLGIQFSKQTLMSLVHRDFESEAKQRITELETEQRLFKDHPELLAPAGGGMEGGGMGGGMGGGAVMPGIPPEQFGDLAPPPDAGGGGEAMPPEPMPEGASAKADKGQGRKPTKPKADIWDAHDRYGVWTRSDVGDLGDVFEGREPDDDPWNRMWENADVRYAVGGGDSSEIWEAVQEWLIDNDYPTRAITQLEDVLTAEGIIGGAPSRKDAQVIDMIEEPTGNGFLTGF